MMKYLSPSKHKLISKGVDSVRQRVQNLIDVNPAINTQSWEDQLIKEFTKRQTETVELVRIKQDTLFTIDHIKKEHDFLTSWDWLYQYSPDFSNNVEKKFNWGLVDVYMKVEGGKIMNILNVGMIT
jgi:lipoate-protein ligase A